MRKPHQEISPLPGDAGIAPGGRFRRWKAWMAGMAGLMALNLAAAQELHPRRSPDGSSDLPRAFLIGEHESPYERMAKAYSPSLLGMYGQDIDRAFASWMGILRDMEEFAEREQFDLKGLKLWMNVFLNADGSLEHIVYYPKPNSRNMDFKDLTAFFDAFCVQFRVKGGFGQACSHFGSANFPTFYGR